MKRHQENYEEFKKTEAKQGLHKDMMQRLKEREDAYIRIAYKEEDGKTKHQLEEERRREMLEYNMKTFGKVSIGVHGKELPKFSESQSNKEWWKTRAGYSDQPLYKSHKLLKQDQKFWAKNDEMYLADTKSEMAPIDPFKTIYQKKIRKQEVIEKVTQAHFNKPNQEQEMLAHHEGPGVKRTHNYRWTTVENQYARKKKRLFDELPTAQPTRADVMPLFSSFNPKGVFKPPASSKDLAASSTNLVKRDTVTAQSNRAKVNNKSQNLGSGGEAMNAIEGNGS